MSDLFELVEPQRVVAVLVGRNRVGEVEASLLEVVNRDIQSHTQLSSLNAMNPRSGVLTRLVGQVLDAADHDDTVLAINRPDDNDIEVAIISAAVFGAGAGLDIPTVWVVQDTAMRGAPQLTGHAETRIVALARNALWLARRGSVTAWTEELRNRGCIDV